MNHDLRFARSLRRGAAMLAILALVVAACGSDELGESAETTTTTTTEVPIVTTTGPEGREQATPPTEDSEAPLDDETDTDVPPSLAPVDDPSIISDKADPSLAGPVDPKLESLYTRAVADLASRLGVPGSDISVIRAEMVVWPDSSRGCPQPDMRYLQVLTDGVWIVLEHQGRPYTYHTSATGVVTLCETTIKQRPVEGAVPGFGDT